MLSKKGDLELRYIVLFILAIIVLIVLVIMFRQEVKQFLDTIFSVTSEINKSRSPIKDLLGT